jgi:hypothetical protein
MKTATAQINVPDRVDDKESRTKAKRAGHFVRPQPTKLRVIYQIWAPSARTGKSTGSHLTYGGSGLQTIR